MQAQDPRGVRLAVRARTRGLTSADVDRALTVDRSLVISWLNRGTLHLVRSEDYPWLHALTTPQLRTGNARRLQQEGVSPAAAERGVAVIERAIASDGPLTRTQLREPVAVAGVRTEGQALVHVLFAATLRGLVVRGPMVAGEQAFVLVRDWLGASPPVDRATALAELARRYLAGHGPADPADLARWAGLTLRDARAGFGLIDSELEAVAGGLVRLTGGPAGAALPEPRLLGAFDPVLLGWTSREAIVGTNQSIVTDNGIFRPFALVAGRAAATWSLPKGEVVLAPFSDITPRQAAALAADARDVVRFLGTGGPASG